MRMMMRSYRAISPVIATIIIIAVTIAIAVAVAGWLMGLWGGFTTRPALSVTNAVLNVTSGELKAYVTNEGQGDADLHSLSIGGIECVIGTDLTVGTSFTISSIKGGASSGTIIKAGDTVLLTATCTKWQNAFTPGTHQSLTIVTKDGSTFGPFSVRVVS